MIVTNELLKRLRSAFSLNIYEVKIWTALLSKGVATAGELSDMADVPRSRSYDVLESLEKKGFIVMKLGRPIKYLAVQPSEIVKRVKKGLLEKAENEVKIIDGIQKSDVFSELNLLFKQGIEHVDPGSIAGSLKGRNNLYNHILNVIDKAEKEVIISTTNDGIIRKLEWMKSTLRKLNNNKVNIKIVAPLKTEEAKSAAKELNEFAKIKDIDMKARFVLVDGKDLVFMVADDKEVHESGDVGIWVITPFFGSALKGLFDSVWSSAGKKE